VKKNGVREDLKESEAEKIWLGRNGTRKTMQKLRLFLPERPHRWPNITRAGEKKAPPAPHANRPATSPQNARSALRSLYGGSYDAQVGREKGRRCGRWPSSLGRPETITEKTAVARSARKRRSTAASPATQLQAACTSTQIREKGVNSVLTHPRHHR